MVGRIICARVGKFGAVANPPRACDQPRTIRRICVAAGKALQHLDFTKGLEGRIS
jgi:hypothetical protein